MTSPFDLAARFGAMTDPRQHAQLFADLPRDIDALCRVVQGLMIHIFWAERYGLKLPEERKREVQIHSVARKLTRILELDPRPLTMPRALDQKLVGNCRDFTLLLTSLLQHHGIPARARCGFSKYFLPGKYEDHWVCEYWDGTRERWLFVDAQLDEFQQQALRLRFSPLDVPRTMFLTGGAAWQLCRAGHADPAKFGIFNMHGWWFVRGDFVRDVAALNKMELLPWDSWGLADAPDDKMTDDDNAFLDHVAELTSGDVPQFDAVRALYEADARLRVPSIITSYPGDGPRKIDLAKETE